jgi:hypothetical protein
MTLRAGMAELIGLVIRIGRPIEIGLVARITILRSSRILPVHMTLCAGNRGMRPGQLEARQCMVKLCGRPAAGRVALSASVIIISGRMIRIRGSIVIRLMARETICRKAAAVLAIGMALPA